MDVFFTFSCDVVVVFSSSLLLLTIIFTFGDWNLPFILLIFLVGGGDGLVGVDRSSTFFFPSQNDVRTLDLSLDEEGELIEFVGDDTGLKLLD